MPISATWIPKPAIVAADLNALAMGIRSFKVPLKKSIQEVLAPSFQHNFDAGGRPSWEPLTLQTLERKQGSSILVETGKLRRVAGQLNLWTINGPQGTASLDSIPSYAWYASIHQLGGPNLPQRPWAVIQEEDVNNIEGVFARWLMERAAAAGFVL